MIMQTVSVKEGEDWVSNIEYMKTKANLDHFIMNFGTFKLPTTSFDLVPSKPSHLSKSPIVNKSGPFQSFA